MKRTVVFGLFMLIGAGSVFGDTPSAPSGMRWAAVDELTDEFDGASIDSSKWYDYHPNWSGRAPSQFKQGNAYVEGGYLNLKSTLRKDPSTVADPFSDIWVDAAACVSKDKSAKPGYYYEAKIKASNLSMTSSFWFRVGNYSEIDVIEHIGNPSQDHRDDDLPYQYHANTHVYGSQSGSSVGKGWTMPTRGRDEFHTFGFWWKDSTTLWFYHNDVKVIEITPSVPFSENLKLIFDTEVFPFATAGVANIGLPLAENLNDDTKNTMKVDWVRTYKLEEETEPTEFVSFVDASSQMTSASQLTFEVNYQALEPRDLYVVIKNPEGTWLGAASTSVAAGSGSATLTVNLGTYSPTPRAGHQIQADLREVGGGWQTISVNDSEAVQFLPNVVPSGPPAAEVGQRWVAMDVLTDEFSSSALNSAKWQADHPYWNGREPSQYNTGNVSVANDMLQLKSTVADDSMQGNWVWSSCVASQEKTALPGMYYEAKIRGSDLSMTSAFWFQGAGIEIDVIENVGHTGKTSDYYVKQRSQMLSNTHSYSGGWENDIITPTHTDMDAESDHRFFTYGVWWKSESEVWLYLDGVKVGEMEPAEPFDAGQYMFFDTETFEWNGLPTIDNLNNPDRNVMYVDWVRSYRIEDDVSTLPGMQVVQAEEFDVDGFYDTTPANQGGVYRASEAVDIQNTTDDGGGYNVGWTVAGEWLEYTLNDVPDWLDSLALRVATLSEGKTLSVQLDGENLGKVDVPNTGNWQAWETVTLNGLQIDSGSGKVLRVKFDNGAVNLNWLQLYAAEPYGIWASTYAVNLGGETGDYDNDGMSNFMEYMADTAPDDEMDLFTITGVGKEGVEFSSSSNRYYTLMWSTNLVDGGWDPVTPGHKGVGGHDFMAVPHNTSADFFKLEVSIPVE